MKELTIVPMTLAEANEFVLKGDHIMTDVILTSPDSVAMPRYKCHKEVFALKIKAILDPNDGLTEDDGERIVTFSDPGYEACAWVLDAEYMRRNKPVSGGYYVVYDDGYKSFSPAKAFEEGYAKL